MKKSILGGIDMNNEIKKKLLDLLQEISYGFEKYEEELEDDGDFWEPWSKMHKYISKLKTD